MGTYTGSDKRLQYLFQNGGGGGTTVIANPQGQATDDLEKIQIDNTIYAIVGGGGGSSLKTYHAAWTATSASASGTPLTDSISLPAGKYLVTADLPYSSETENSAFIGLLVNNALRLDMLARVPRTYGQYVAELEISSPSVIQLASASNASYTWASQYIDRGGLDVISLEVNGSSGEPDYDDLIFSDSYTCPSSPYDYSYTATEDCFVFASIVGGANTNPYAQIKDGNTVIATAFDQYCQTLLQQSFSCFLPKGKTLLIHSTYTGAQLAFRAYGLKVMGTLETKYTSSEQVIGTWFGKPLYQKVIVDTINLNNGDTVKMSNIKDSTMEIRNHDVQISHGNEVYKNGSFGNSAAILSSYACNLYISGNDLRGPCVWGNTSTATCRIILQYTKNTD